MTEKEIKEEATEYAMKCNILSDCFSAGAKWALNHQWIDAKETLPETDEASHDGSPCSDLVLCHTKRFNELLILCLCRDVNDTYWSDSWEFTESVTDLDDVDYWMPIPPKLKIK